MSRNRYILEINPDIAKSIVVFSMVGESGITAAFKIDDLEVLNSDYINEHYGDLQDTAYQRGLEDAWNVARKIAVETDDGGVSISALYEMFGTESICMIMKNNTVHDVTNKLKDYEEKQKTDNCIEIGDEVEWYGDKYIVTYRNIDPNIGVIQDYDLLAYDGSVVDHVKKCVFTKTGRHFDIASIFKEMQS